MRWLLVSSLALLPVLINAGQCTECRAVYENDCNYKTCATSCQLNPDACTECSKVCFHKHCKHACADNWNADEEKSCSSCLDHARENCNFKQCLGTCKKAPQGDACERCADDCSKEKCFHRCGSSPPTNEEIVQLGKDQICGGYEGSGWEVFDYNTAVKYDAPSKHRTGISMRISTAHCNFTSVPTYAASLKVPIDVMPTTTGAMTISFNKVKDASKGVRVHMWHPLESGRELLKLSEVHGWVVSWIGVTGPEKHGSTDPSSATWTPWPGTKDMMGLKVRTELSNCALKPKYIISFYGAARIQGANRVYEAKQDSFRVYVNSPDTANKKIFASNKYTVAWLCLPQVSGQSSTDWDDSIRDGKATKIRVDLSKKHWPIAPMFVISCDMGEDTIPTANPWGISTITRVSINGFHAYLGPYSLSGKAVTTEIAWGQQYKFNYIAFLPSIKPRKCEMAQWTAWSPCSATCDGGTTTRMRSIVLRPWPYIVNGSFQTCPQTTQHKKCGTRPCFIPTKRIDVQMVVSGVPTATYVQICQKYLMLQLALKLPIDPKRINITQVQSSEHDKIQKNTMAVEFSTSFKVTLFARDGGVAKHLAKRLGSQDIADLIRKDLHIQDLLKMADDDAPSDHIYFRFQSSPRITDSAAYRDELREREQAAAKAQVALKQQQAAAAAATKKADAAEAAAEKKAMNLRAEQKKKAQLKKQEEVLASMIAKDEAKQASSTERKLLIGGLFGVALSVGGVLGYLYTHQPGAEVEGDIEEATAEAGRPEGGEEDSLIADGQDVRYTD